VHAFQRSGPSGGSSPSRATSRLSIPIQADREAAELRVPDDRGVGARHRAPALEVPPIPVDHHPEQRSHREGLLALGIAPRIEEVPDRLE